MALRSMTVHRYEEIRRRLAEGRGLREIARALGCSRRTVREVRDGERLAPVVGTRRGEQIHRGTERIGREESQSAQPLIKFVRIESHVSVQPFPCGAIRTELPNRHGGRR